MGSTAPRCPTCAKYPTLYPPQRTQCSASASASASASVYAYASAYASSSCPSECVEFYKFVEVANNYEESPFQTYSFPDGPRKFWEEWDLRILILCILYSQLCLLIFGRFRRRLKRKILINLNVWLLYIFADLLAAIALGKLSQVKDEGKFNKDALFEFNPKEICSPKKPESLLRGLWAPVILFYLGGPDTVTLLFIEETHLWMRHIISLLTQGARACYVLIVTWTPSGLSVLSVLMLISGIIKYAERIWVIKSRTRAISEGFLQPNDCTVMDVVGISPASTHSKLELEDQTKLVVEGYICFQTLKPHIPGYNGLKRPLAKFMKRETDSKDIFKQIEIELGFMYDVLFSKVGTIFTAWGFILRYITLSCVVCVLVGFFLVETPSTEDLENDVYVTITLLLGAIFLEIVGLLLQLVSDWAVVWAWKHQTKLSSPVLSLHKHLISERQRWSEEVGQFSLLNFCTKYEETVFNGMVQALCGRSKLLSINFSLPSSTADRTIRDLIIKQLRDRSQKNSGQPSQISSMKAGEWTLPNFGLETALKWTMNGEFGDAIVLWHLATDICYHSKDEEHSTYSEAAKILSYYMMHLLLICPNTLPFCNTDGDFLTACRDIMEILKNQKPTLTDACEHLKMIPRERCKSIAVKCAELARTLMQKPNEERWKIMSSMWVEMLCHAAKECKLKYHAQELRHGGEFLTHVWLLLMHFGIVRDKDKIIPPDLRPTAREGIKGLNDLSQSTFFKECTLRCSEGGCPF